MRSVIARALVLTVVAMLSLGSLPSLVWCDETILHEQVTLTSIDAPASEAWEFSLTSGDTISIEISVTGDPINFYIYNSEGDEPFQSTNLMTLEDQWNVPYDDTFEFLIETWASENAQAIVDITLYRTSALLHDIAVISVVPSPTEVYEGDSVNIAVVVQNNGNSIETFSVTTYANTTIIQTQTVSNLTPNTQSTLTFTWNTTGFSLGNYTIKAEASIVPGETHAADNGKVNGVVRMIPESPFNLPPIVSDPYPPDGATGVPISLSELNFDLADPDGDIMSYTVTSDVGSGNGNNVSNGRYTVLVSGLDYETTYTWQVDVTDGTHWTNATFTFTTELEHQPIQYTLLIEVSGSGTTDPAPGTYHYDKGTKVSVTAIPDSGWMLGHWILNGTNVGKENPYTVTTNANYNLTPIFVEAPPAQHTLTIEVRGSGYTYPAVGSYLYDEGTSVSVAASPKSSWTLSHWLLNGTNVGSAHSYNVTMDANYNLTAVFVENRPVQFPTWPLILLVFPLIIVLIIYKRRVLKTPRA